MYKGVWIVSAGLAAGGLATVLYIHLAGTAKVGVDDVRGSPATLGHADTAVEEFVNGGSADEESPASRDAQSQHVGTDESDTGDPSPPPPMLNPVALSGFPATEYEHMLIEQPVDPHWAPRMESRIYEFIAEAELPLTTMQVHCRTSICRVEVGLDIAQAHDRDNLHEMVLRFGEALGSAYRGGGWRANASSAGVYGDRLAQNLPGMGSRGYLQSIIGYIHPRQMEIFSSEEEWEEAMRNRREQW